MYVRQCVKTNLEIIESPLKPLLVKASQKTKIKCIKENGTLCIFWRVN